MNSIALCRVPAIPVNNFSARAFFRLPPHINGLLQLVTWGSHIYLIRSSDAGIIAGNHPLMKIHMRNLTDALFANLSMRKASFPRLWVRVNDWVYVYRVVRGLML